MTALILTIVQICVLLFVVIFVLSIHLSLLFDRHYILSAEGNTLPGEIQIHMLQHMNINWK